MQRPFIFIILLLSWLLGAPLAYANDSSAALTLGGLELQQNDAVSMDSEKLYLSAKRVRVTYRFTNHSDTDVVTLVSFPLPAIPKDIDEDMGDSGFPNWSQLDFVTKVDGQPVKLDHMELAEVAGRDVSARLNVLGWPIKYWLDDAFLLDLRELPEDQRSALVEEGLIRQEHGWVLPTWSVATHVTRQQVFPAGKSITVEHSYVPILGQSIAGELAPHVRGNPDYGFQDYRKSYCMDDDFIAGFDKRRTALGDVGDQYVESYLNYRLSPGANWRGPIKHFELTIDKGNADNLISLCIDDIRKTGPTQFSVIKKDFEPKQDIQAVIVQWFPARPE